MQPHTQAFAARAIAAQTSIIAGSPLAVAVVVLANARCTSRGPMSGTASSSSAATLATCAAAYDEPETKPQCSPGSVAGMSRPGANSAPGGGVAPCSDITA